MITQPYLSAAFNVYISSAVARAESSSETVAVVMQNINVDGFKIVSPESTYYFIVNSNLVVLQHSAMNKTSTLLSLA